MQLLRPARMATQALGVDRFGASFGEKEQLGGICRVSDVVGGGAVARFAALLCRASSRVV